MDTSSNIVEISEIALEQILELRALETVPDLTLGLRVAGVGANGFVYETAFMRSEDVADSDHKEQHGDLPADSDFFFGGRCRGRRQCRCQLGRRAAAAGHNKQRKREHKAPDGVKSELGIH